jgi:hypothetical protein
MAGPVALGAVTELLTHWLHVAAAPLASRNLKGGQVSMDNASANT